MSGTSIFDPVLCELMYKWFNVEGGSIIDPFAGGSVRGIVASYLGYKYHGNDIRQEQIDANYQNAQECGVEAPVWTCGDSTDIANIVEKKEYDMLFTCPPYGDLEVYSDNPQDISTMEAGEFDKAYRHILHECSELLKDNSFAVVVISNIRDKKGYYRDLCNLTTKAFEEKGLHLYNDMVMLDYIGTGALRCTKIFNASRKVIRLHQNVLVYYKGDPAKIKEKHKALEFPDINVDE